MAIKHLLFISYRRGPGINNTVRILKDELEKKLTGYAGDGVSCNVGINSTVYYDEQIIIGDSIPNSLRDKLCESLCMIPLITRNYINTNHKYCAKELLLFWRIQKIRNKHLKKHLGDSVDCQQSHLIPFAIDMEATSNKIPDQIRDLKVQVIDSGLYDCLASTRLSIDPNSIEFRKIIEKVKIKIRKTIDFLEDNEFDYDAIKYDLEIPHDEDEELITLIENRKLPNEFPDSELRNTYE